MSEFKIGDKVMVDFGKYGKIDYQEDVIIGETKTLWKCNKFSFSKTGSHTLRGLGEWDYSYAQPYNEKLMEEVKRKSQIREAFSKAEQKLRTIGNNYEKMQLFADFVKENL